MADEPCDWCGKHHGERTIANWYLKGIKPGEVQMKDGQKISFIAVAVDNTAHAVGPVQRINDADYLCLHEDAARALFMGLLKSLAELWGDPVCEALDKVLTRMMDDKVLEGIAVLFEQHQRATRKRKTPKNEVH